MSNKSRKNKSSQSPKQKPITVTKDDPLNEIVKEAVEETKTIVPTDKQPAEFTFESTVRVTGLRIHKAAIELECIARELNTETIFGITAARFQTFADKIGKYPKQLENKAKRERRRLTQTETKEEKKEKKATALRNKIEALQTKLAKL